MQVTIPTRRHLIVALILGAFEGILFLIGDALSKTYGLVMGLIIIVLLNAFIYLVAAIGTR